MPKAPASRQFDVREARTIVWRRKWLIVIPLILVSAITYAGSYLITPVYESSVIISIGNEIRLSTDLQRLLGIEPSYRRGGRERDRLRAIFNEITSSLYLAQLVERLRLGDDPGLNAEVERLIAERPGASPDDIKLDLIQSDLQDRIQVGFAAEDQIRITIESTDPAQARDIANTLGGIFIEENLKEELLSIRSSQDFSDIQLQKYERLVHDKIEERARVEKELLAVQLDESVMADSNRSDIMSEINRAKNEIEDYRGQERDLLTQLRNVPGINTSSLALTDSPDMKAMTGELAEQIGSVANLMIRYTWSDPQILNFKVRLNTLITRLERENERLVNEQFSSYSDDTRTLLVRLFDVRSNLDYLAAKVSHFESALSELMGQMNLIPEYQARLNRIDEEIETARDMRDRFERQQESSSISQALLQEGSSAKYKVVEPAKLAMEPVRPDRAKIVMLGLALGLILGGGAALIVELLDSSFKKTEDVEEFLDLPVLGVAPKIEHIKRVGR